MSIRIVLAAALLMFGMAMSTAFAQSAATTQGTAQAANNVNVVAASGLGSGTEHMVYSGHEWTTPNVQGSYFAGANPCLIGVGGGVAGGPAAININWGRNDPGCQARSDAAAWHGLGLDNVAIARMCELEKDKIAYEAAGYTCPEDVKRVAAVEPTHPVAMVVPHPVAPPVQHVAITQPVHPAWCDTVTGPEEHARFARACGFN